MNRIRTTGLAIGVFPAALVALIAAPVAADAVFQATAEGGDSNVTPLPPAHIDGSDSGPGQTYDWDITAGRGQLHSYHGLYHCCNDHKWTVARFTIDDLVFSSPGEQGGTATVAFNFDFQATGTCNQGAGGGAGVSLSVGQAGPQIGAWQAGGVLCAGYDSSGVFTGFNDLSIIGSFTTPAFQVPLDVPLVMQFTLSGGVGSYQGWGAIDATVNLPDPLSGTPVFDILAGPAGITVDSAQMNVTANAWGGPTLPCPADVAGGDGAVGVTDLLAVLAAWGTPDADVTGDGMTDVSDLLAVLAAWGPCD